MGKYFLIIIIEKEELTLYKSFKVSDNRAQLHLSVCLEERFLCRKNTL